MNYLTLILITFFIFEIMVSIFLFFIFKSISKMKLDIEKIRADIEITSKESYVNDKKLRRIISETNKEITMVERTLSSEIKKTSQNNF